MARAETSDKRQGVVSSPPTGLAAPVCPWWVGTSGYSYTEWIEAGFYPPGTRSSQMLELYAHTFSATELNYTWYQLPRAETMVSQLSRAPQGFRFAAKLTRSLTHEVEPSAWRGQLHAYREGIAPLVQSDQLLAVLIQLPPGFDRSVANRRYLDQLLDGLQGLPLAVEFRNSSWLHDRVYDELRQRRITLVTVDEPDLPGLLPPLTVVTNPALVYVRFHGRNNRGWRSGKMQLQFDYDYTEPELQEWAALRIAPMSGQASQGAIFFNNHVQAQAPRNAELLRRLLQQQGLSVVEPPRAEVTPADEAADLLRGTAGMKRGAHG